MSTLRFDNCFDSHVHWLATGGHAHRLRLDHLKSPEEIVHVKVEPHHFRGEWLTGFGWNQNSWSRGEFPNRFQLDAVFRDFPVAFSRADGHATWVNTAALQRAGLLTADGEPGEIPASFRAQIHADAKGCPTGVLLDSAKSLIDRQIPAITPTQVRAELLQGARAFNRSGYTHIRDLTCDETQWNEACHLADAQLLTVAVEQFFSAWKAEEFDGALALAQRARKDPRPLLRPVGIKVFLDGALGSEGAYLSHDYGSGSGRGFLLLSEAQIREFMARSWESKFDFAVHTIGDEAAHIVARVAHGLWSEGRTGRLHLEHAEIVRPETIALLRDRDVVCHMQPSHWLSDKVWLEKKIGGLIRHAFPWRALQDANIPIFFGSDSPIEAPALDLIFKALKDSADHGIPPLSGAPYRHLSHPDPLWTANSYTLWEDGLVREVIFQGHHVFTAT